VLRAATLHCLLSLLLLSTAACDSAPGASRATLQVRLASAATTATIARVTVTVSAGGGAPFDAFALDCSPGDAGWSAEVSAVPAGAERQFDFHALDPSGSVLYAGSTRADVPAGGVVVITAVLQAASGPAVVSSTPVIDALSASASSAPPGAGITLRASVHAVDPDDTVTLHWQATCGQVRGVSAADILWIAPETAGTCTVSLTASGRAGSVSVSLPLSAE
jgi:hypothetical protein